MKKTVLHIVFVLMLCSLILILPVAADTIPPTVVSTDPIGGAYNVPLNVKIIATMNEEINRCVGIVELADHTGNIVEISDDWDAPDYIHLEFQPASLLNKGETYTVTLRGLIDFDNNVMPDHSWAFTTTGFPPTTEIATQDSYSIFPRCGWYNTSVQVTLSATDYSGTGIQKTEYSLDGGDWNTYDDTFTIDGEGITTIAYRSIDNDGNSESPRSLDVKIDKTPPTITGVVIDPVTQSPLLPNANGWYSSDVTVRFTARDDLSGILHYGHPGEDLFWDTKLCSEGANQIAPMTQKDMPGSPATVTVMVSIDKTPPTITINVPVNCAHYILNEDVHADWTTSDSLSGVATQSGTVPMGSAIDTTTVGIKQFTVTATDLSDNQNIKIISYTVDSPADANNALSMKVDSLELPAAVETGLIDKLTAAQARIVQKKYTPARNTLNAFINQVNAQTGKAINPGDADDLIAIAQRIINSIPGK